MFVHEGLVGIHQVFKVSGKEDIEATGLDEVSGTGHRLVGEGGKRGLGVA